MNYDPHLLDGFNDSMFPEHLRDYDSLSQHFHSNLDSLSNHQKGEKFCNFVRKLVPLTPFGSTFETPVINPKKSWDRGVDLIAESEDRDRTLYIQSKFSISSAKDIDTIISDFHEFIKTPDPKRPGQQTLPNFDDKISFFQVVTLSPLKGILSQYEKKEYASKDFYRSLMGASKLNFIDGHQLLPLIKGAFSKIGEPPFSLVLNFESSLIKKDNVYIGLISSGELKRLYSEYGEALFFENVRDFLGANTQQKKSTSQRTPNAEMIKTIKDEPEKMLARNNGIVFGAKQVQLESETQLILSSGSVVNGCQTTMCIVENSNDTKPCSVVVKVVETRANSWDITKSANHQNSIPEIDLDLAHYLRPQLVTKAAATYGKQIADRQQSAFQILDDIYAQKIVYKETRLLYIGLFSRIPNNIYVLDYGELLASIIDRFYPKEDPYGEKTFDTIFQLQEIAKQGLEKARGTFTNYAEVFDRIYADNHVVYRCHITLLALCATLNVNLAKREKDSQLEYERMKKFLDDTQYVIENRKDKFLKIYRHAVKTWMREVTRGRDSTRVSDPKTIQQIMHRRSGESNFTALFMDVCQDRDDDDFLKQEEIDYNAKIF